jgi:ribosome-associated protein
MSTPLPAIAPIALTWRFTRASGPGGQHVNKTSTRVELDCDLALCGFAEVLTNRLIAKLGPVVQISVSETRSQTRNRDIAEQRLVETLTAAAVVPRARRATRPRKGAVENRLATKRKTSERKSNRSWQPGSD